MTVCFSYLCQNREEDPDNSDTFRCIEIVFFFLSYLKHLAFVRPLPGNIDVSMTLTKLAFFVPNHSCGPAHAVFFLCHPSPLFCCCYIPSSVRYSAQPQHPPGKSTNAPRAAQKSPTHRFAATRKRLHHQARGHDDWQPITPPPPKERGEEQSRGNQGKKRHLRHFTLPCGPQGRAAQKNQ